MNRSCCGHCQRPVAADFRTRAFFCEETSVFFCSFGCFTAHQRGPVIQLQIGGIQLYWDAILRRSVPV